MESGEEGGKSYEDDETRACWTWVMLLLLMSKICSKYSSVSSPLRFSSSLSGGSRRIVSSDSVLGPLKRVSSPKSKNSTTVKGTSRSIFLSFQIT